MLGISTLARSLHRGVSDNSLFSDEPVIVAHFSWFLATELRGLNCPEPSQLEAEHFVPIFMSFQLPVPPPMGSQTKAPYIFSPPAK